MYIVQTSSKSYYWSRLIWGFRGWGWIGRPGLVVFGMQVLMGLYLSKLENYFLFQIWFIEIEKKNLWTGFEIGKKYLFHVAKLLFMLCKSNNLCSYLESIVSKWTAGSWNRARIPVSSGLVSLLQLRSLRSISNLRYCVVGTFSWLDSSNLNWEYWIMCPRGSVGWTHWIPLAPLSIL